MKTILVSTLTLVLGLGVGFYLAGPGALLPAEGGSAAESSEKQPLYWVAPMDPNYKRDKPGLSPMGMDLIPVYEESDNADSPGLIEIAPEVENNLGVRTALVEREIMVPEVRSVGYIGFDQDSLWQINSRVSGWVESLRVKTEGERISQGQPLLELYSPELVKAQEELLNALRLGNKILITSSRTRLEALGVSPGQISHIERNRRVKQRITLYARNDGYLSKLNVREGAYVSPATLVLEAGRLDSVWLEAELFESQAGLVNEGDPAQMSLDFYPGETWSGTVDHIYPVLSEETRTLRVRLVFANPDERLKPNMFARIRLLPEAGEPVLQISREAVIRSGQVDRVVMARGEGKYQSVAVRLGRESNGMVEVLEGLEASDRIVTSAQFMLDSESSLTADFSRMGPPERWIESTKVTGVVVRAREGVLTIAHDPVPDWNWPGMVMDFPLAEGVGTDGIAPGRAVTFEIIKQAGQFPIQSITAGEMKGLPINYELDHSKMDHSTIDHSTMDHSEIQDEAPDLDFLDLDMDEGEQP